MFIDVCLLTLPIYQEVYQSYNSYANTGNDSGNSNRRLKEEQRNSDVQQIDGPNLQLTLKIIIVEKL